MRLLRRPTAGMAGFLALWGALWMGTGDSLTAVRVGVYLAEFVLAAAILTTLCAAMFRQWPAALAAGLVTGGLASAMPPSMWRLSPPRDVSAETIRLTTLSNRTANPDMAGTARALRQDAADILVLQEIADPPALLRLLGGLHQPGEAPHHCRHRNYLIVSRFPLGPASRMPGNPAMNCRIELPMGPATIYSVHLPRGFPDGERQNGAARQVLAHARAQPGGAILAGDFNATRLSGPILLLSDNLTNAFDVAGAGAGFTFPAPGRRIGRAGAFLRIDHVLMSERFLPVRAEVAGWQSPGADHLPVTVTFVDRSVR